ncbi:MAG: glycosyltransferase [Nitratireductor sp.]
MGIGEHFAGSKFADRVVRSSAVAPGRLPADISFLPAVGIDDKLLEAAARISRLRPGTIASEILIARGILSRDAYESALADHLGAEFLAHGPDPAGLTDTEAGLGNPAIIALENNRRRLFIAPQIVGYLKIAEQEQQMPGRFRATIFCPADTLRLAVFENRREAFLDHAVHGLQREFPEYSAAVRLTRGQVGWMATLAFVFAVLLAVLPASTLAVGGLLLSVFYFAIIVLRSLLIVLLDHVAPHAATGHLQGRKIAPEEHPVYSVMVALYREAGQINELVAALDRIDWPRTRREILLICEEDDRDTINAIRRTNLPHGFRLLVCPQAQPKTKPKALAWALPLCSGEYCVIYDAEDRPHPQQLQQAWVKFRKGDARLACLQAPLVIHNHRQNWLTSMFAIEYHAQFLGMLPALEYLNAPIPLGGTSNHFRMAALRRLGGWDPYNVTEDADLGIRMARFGYSCGTISAPTLEEAPPVLDVWLKQRTRWLKGWLQTVLVHMRDPARTTRELGPMNTAMFHLVITAIVISMLIHPAFLIHVCWQAFSLAQGKPLSAFGLAITWLTFFNLAAGYTTYAALVLTVRMRSGWRKSGFYLLTLPAYWLLISIAGWRALFQLATDPFKWEKTTHGLSNWAHHANITGVTLDTGNPEFSGEDIDGSRRMAP